MRGDQISHAAAKRGLNKLFVLLSRIPLPENECLQPSTVHMYLKKHIQSDTQMES